MKTLDALVVEGLAAGVEPAAGEVSVLGELHLHLEAFRGANHREELQDVAGAVEFGGGGARVGVDDDVLGELDDDLLHHVYLSHALGDALPGGADDAERVAAVVIFVEKFEEAGAADGFVVDGGSIEDQVGVDVHGAAHDPHDVPGLR